MKTIVAFTFAVLAVASAAQAKDARAKPLTLGLQVENRDLQALAPGGSRPVFGPSLPGAASCGGDHAEPIVGVQGAVFGYSCSTASANGG